MSRLRSGSRLAALAVLLVIAVLAGAGPASAHATLTGSDPGNGDSLDAVPEQVTLEFSAPISEPAYVIVTAPDGSKVADGDASVDGQTLEQGLQDGTDAEGEYTVAYRAVSDDGHPLTGQLSFQVGDGPAAPDASSDAAAGSDAGGSADDSDDSDVTAEDEAAGASPDGPDDSGGSGGDSAWLRFGVPAALLLGAGGLLLLARRERPVEQNG